MAPSDGTLEPELPPDQVDIAETPTLRDKIILWLQRRPGRDWYFLTIGTVLVLVLAWLGISDWRPFAHMGNSSTATDGVIIITNSHANVPIPELSPISRDLVKSAIREGLRIGLIEGDGRPSVIALPSTEVRNDLMIAPALKMVEDALVVDPDENGSNAYGALAVARDFAIAHGLSSPTIICLMCGLDTTPDVLDLTPKEALLEPPTLVAFFLRASGNFVDFRADFEHVHVVLTSTAAVAPPQDALSQANQQRVVSIWEQVIKDGGATVTLDPFPRGGPSIKTDKVVPTVSPPA